MSEQRVFFGSWNDQQDMERDFGVSGQLGSDIEILFADYEVGRYDLFSFFRQRLDGNAVVVFRQDGKLFYVGASHCSCYDLEGQWEGDEVYEEQLAAMDQSDLSEEAIAAYDKLWPYKELPR